ncbi:predicted protein [Histoplasma capsulatum G186AR]|uniref:Uncharacterized protein n=1 Tax=Ajellomyces capsulatus (strain G186AR / H82 / ATCC MYA-2454 / RMSCC 2432) TaxID=447093 RepID=C0NMR5_AJECG|nr:uncharacterized protein HCBG_04042 [Histoplasma capsulatum G186AR]EEH07163.1 predicted protein [Histoplasma capsulatum G186AR]
MHRIDRRSWPNGDEALVPRRREEPRSQAFPRLVLQLLNCHSVLSAMEKATLFQWLWITPPHHYCCCLARGYLAAFESAFELYQIHVLGCGTHCCSSDFTSRRSATVKHRKSRKLASYTHPQTSISAYYTPNNTPLTILRTQHAHDASNVIRKSRPSPTHLLPDERLNLLTQLLHTRPRKSIVHRKLDVGRIVLPTSHGHPKVISCLLVHTPDDRTRADGMDL